MAIDRNRLEQEALRLLQRGQNEQALDRYLTLLRDKPRDLRVRQQVADLYLKVGQKGKAEQHLREIARFHKNSGKKRAAIGVYKQILRIKPDDMALYGDLGECYESAGFPKEARQAFEKVVVSLSKYNPDKAVPYQQRLIALQPGNLPVQVKLAELYEQANWAEKAQGEWRRLAKEARRYGKLDDRARFLMKSLAVREDLDIAVEAAEAQVDVGEFDAALPLLQNVTTSRPEDPLALSLLARTLMGLGAKDKARQVWLVVARLHAAAGRASDRAAALEQALEAGAEDSSLKAEVAAAKLLADRMALRLTDQPWAEPPDGAAGELVVRAAVFLRYGFAEKSLEALQATGGHQSSLAVQASLVEAKAQLGDTEGALDVLRRMSPPDDAARADLHTREMVLTGRIEDIGKVPDEADLIDDELLDDELLDDDLLDDEATDPGPEASDPSDGADALLDDELLDDELIDDDPTAEPVGAGPESGGDDDGLGALFGDSLEPVSAANAGDEDDGLADLFGGALSEPEPAVPVADSSAGDPSARMLAPPVLSVGEGGLGDAEALLRVGAFDAAREIARSGSSLMHALVHAKVIRAQGDWSSALATLREAVAEAAEDDPGYLPGIVEMAELNVGTGKIRAARRLLDEAEDIDPNFQSARIQIVRRGIALLK